MSEEIRVITKDQYDEYMELKKQVADATKKVRWKPKEGEPYWHIYDDGTIDYDFWTSENDILLGRYKLGNCFETEGEAQKELDRRIAERELLDLCDWEGEESAYFIEYNDKRDVFYWDWFNFIYSPYRFATDESVKKAIDTLGEEKLKLIFRID